MVRAAPPDRSGVNRQPGHEGNLDVQVDTIEEGARDALSVDFDLARYAATIALGISIVGAGTWIPSSRDRGSVPALDGLGALWWCRVVKARRGRAELELARWIASLLLPRCGMNNARFQFPSRVLAVNNMPAFHGIELISFGSAPFSANPYALTSTSSSCSRRSYCLII